MAKKKTRDKIKEMGLSDKGKIDWDSSDPSMDEYVHVYPEKDVKEFIDEFMSDIEQEQKLANNQDWKRSILFLKGQFERKVGGELI